jgi:hypothetical protein
MRLYECLTCTWCSCPIEVPFLETIEHLKLHPKCVELAIMAALDQRGRAAVVETVQLYSAPGVPFTGEPAEPVNPVADVDDYADYPGWDEPESPPAEPEKEEAEPESEVEEPTSPQELAQIVKAAVQSVPASPAAVPVGMKQCPDCEPGHLLPKTAEHFYLTPRGTVSFPRCRKHHNLHCARMKREKCQQERENSVERALEAASEGPSPVTNEPHCVAVEAPAPESVPVVFPDHEQMKFRREDLKLSREAVAFAIEGSADALKLFEAGKNRLGDAWIRRLQAFYARMEELPESERERHRFPFGANGTEQTAAKMFGPAFTKVG